MSATEPDYTVCGVFPTQQEAESACAWYRAKAQWGMTFTPKRVPDGWVVEQDCTPEFSAAIYRKYA